MSKPSQSKSSQSIINEIINHSDQRIFDWTQKDKELNTLNNDLYNQLNSLTEEQIRVLEPIISAYTARLMVIAYLKGFKDHDELKESLHEPIENLLAKYNINENN